VVLTGSPGDYTDLALYKPTELCGCIGSLVPMDTCRHTVVGIDKKYSYTLLL